jgi:hypothetical protein
MLCFVERLGLLTEYCCKEEKAGKFHHKVTVKPSDGEICFAKEIIKNPLGNFLRKEFCWILLDLHDFCAEALLLGNLLRKRNHPNRTNLSNRYFLPAMLKGFASQRNLVKFQIYCLI